MILTSRVTVSALPLLITGFSLVSLGSLPASAAPTPASRIVVKSDGSIGRYAFLPVHHDPSHLSSVIARLNASSRSVTLLPTEYQITTDLLPAVRDQGERGTCAYFATLGILESYYLAKTSNRLDLSEECLVDVRNWMYDQGASYKGDDAPAQRPDPNGDLPKSIIKTITEDGVPMATEFSSTLSCVYDGSNDNGNDVSLADYLGTQTSYGKGLGFDQNTAPTIEAVKASIAAGHPVEIGVVVYNEFMSGTDWRFDPKLDVSGDIAGGHAIMLTGYKVDGAKTIFTFKNSWGSTWGNSGYGTMDDGVLTNSWAYDPSFDFAVSLHD